MRRMKGGMRGKKEREGEMKGGREGEKKKTEHTTLEARAPRVWRLTRLDTEYCAANPGPGAQEQGQYKSKK